jgi:hypothetical protein
MHEHADAVKQSINVAEFAVSANDLAQRFASGR